ncbi:hypothetical protein HF086_006245 [Spodoptera exigua]|uniref:Peptidase M14 domain-containing protein n=1 Tax=Spodoptera exigua TaxID=7107 RepID=A0A922MFU7_SPOEX|nr:hypothetical protein HF086_006245 [Spodoptera exigua]
MTRLVICVLLCVASFVQGGHEKYEGIFRKEEAEIQSKKAAAKRSGKSMSWDTYYRHEEINAYLDELAEEHPDLVTVVNAGLSFEGRQIKYVRISSTRFENLRKPVIVIDAMAHAREWVTTPVAMYIIHQLVVEAPESPLTQSIDWIIIPVVNPDGYEYSIDVAPFVFIHNAVAKVLMRKRLFLIRNIYFINLIIDLLVSSDYRSMLPFILDEYDGMYVTFFVVLQDRLWRKTRSTAHDGADECPGVDVNRNFDHHWGTAPNSANPCSIIYEGPSAFSEPETRVVRSAVTSSLERTSLYISLHSYGNMFLYAWGNNGTLPQNGLILHLVGVNMATAIDELALDEANRYIVGNAANVLYYTTGTSRDWTKAVGIPLTYTLELPGYDYLFEVPAKYVEQIVTETWAGIAVGAQYVLSTW